MTITIYKKAVIGLLVFNVILEVFSNFTNINGFTCCVYVCVCVSMSACLSDGFLGLLKGVYLVYSNYCKINTVSLDIFVAF